MKAYLLEVLIIDHDKLGQEEIVSVIENARYPNRCISPQVKEVNVRDIGEWTDEHPLNKHETSEDEFRRLFGYR